MRSEAPPASAVPASATAELALVPVGGGSLGSGGALLKDRSTGNGGGSACTVCCTSVRSAVGPYCMEIDEPPTPYKFAEVVALPV